MTSHHVTDAQVEKPHRKAEVLSQNRGVVGLKRLIGEASDSRERLNMKNRNLRA